jgi:hypothetical protein
LTNCALSKGQKRQAANTRRIRIGKGKSRRRMSLKLLTWVPVSCG